MADGAAVGGQRCSAVAARAVGIKEAERGGGTRRAGAAVESEAAEPGMRKIKKRRGCQASYNLRGISISKFHISQFSRFLPQFSEHYKHLGTKQLQCNKPLKSLLFKSLDWIM
ncbi:hypothetical protein XENOCAPTIV_011324 [Xenoophorus captivus]|uniref:Uncharacterized protein n=1 Tax=Xenoophorus captivus TaxID=1517983 RepID=A0ABV0Q9C8_9TELE